MAETPCKITKTRLARLEPMRKAAARHVKLTQRKRAASHWDRIHGDRSSG